MDLSTVILDGVCCCIKWDQHHASYVTQ